MTAIDGEGRATIVLAARDGERWAGAAFLCHVLAGITDVVGQDGMGDAGLDEAFAALYERSEVDAIEGMPELARRLLAGSLSLCGPKAPPSLRYWIERTAGPDFRVDPDVGLFGDWDPTTLPFDEMPGRARRVLAACPHWADSSDLTAELAREVAMRGARIPRPETSDAGAYRATCSSIASPAGPSFISGCSCGWPPSGERRGRTTWVNRPWPSPGNSPTRNMPSRATRSSSS